MVKAVNLTKSGLDELTKELTELKIRRLENADKLKAAKDMGDLSENSDWVNAQDEYKFIEGRIDEVERVLNNYTLIKIPRTNKEVQLGSKVTVQQNGKKVLYYIVGSLESNPTDGKISENSPMGKSLLGKAVGESVDIKAPSGKTTYKIVKISWINMSFKNA